jgi:hypothetical protein
MRYRRTTPELKGDPFLPETTLSDKELEHKFRNFCVAQLGEWQTESAIETVHSFERESSVDRLIHYLVAAGSGAHTSPGTA